MTNAFIWWAAKARIKTKFNKVAGSMGSGMNYGMSAAGQMQPADENQYDILVDELQRDHAETQGVINNQQQQLQQQSMMMQQMQQQMAMNSQQMWQGQQQQPNNQWNNNNGGRSNKKKKEHEAAEATSHR